MIEESASTDQEIRDETTPSSNSPVILPQPSAPESDAIDLTADSDEEAEGNNYAGSQPSGSGDVGRNGGLELGNGARALATSHGVQQPNFTPQHNNRTYEFRSWQPPGMVDPAQESNEPNDANGHGGQASPRQPIGQQSNGFSNGAGPNGFSFGAPPPPHIIPGPGPSFTSQYPTNTAPNHPFYRQTHTTHPPGGTGPPLTYLPLGAANGGTSMSSAIDLTSIRIPTPPPPKDPKQPICMGAISSRALMLYPSQTAIIGTGPPEGIKERYELREWRGAEFIKVKLKLRAAGAIPRDDSPGIDTSRDGIQVTTPSLASYLGDLDLGLANILIPHMQRGLLRLEGWAQRLQPDAPQYQIRVNVLLFTLPSNVKHISTSLWQNNHFLSDPIPPYDPNRHADRPPYHNPHMHDEETRRLVNMQLTHMSSLGRFGNPHSGGFGMGSSAMDKAKQVEVQRQQVDDVFKSLDKGVELAQSDPGPLIKTDLFPHQRKALTFLLEREGDSSCLKKCRKTQDKKQEKKEKAKRKNGEAKREADKKESSESVSGSVNGDAEKNGEDEDDKKGKKGKRDLGRSLWEPLEDDKGRIRGYKNKITSEKRKGKEVPDEGKGAILADDMGLGKTLTIVSLIAATRASARKWARSKAAESDSDIEEIKPSISASGFANRVFGMPEVESEDEKKLKPSAKKRKREEADEKNAAARQARIQLRSRGNLLICPMSTITNWEDQIKEHWNGRVEIVGGSGINPKDVVSRRSNVTKRNGAESSDDEDVSDFDLLRVYVYHGAAKVCNPVFLADFDIVITSYNTLALEYSRMSVAPSDDPTPVDTADNSDEEAVPILGDTSLNARAVKPEVEAEIKASEVADKLRKVEAKRKGRPAVKKVEKSVLQAVDWFRIVLDEAHYIKTASTVASKAACYLAADRRIALTGTPIQNKIEDIWALFKFLRLDPVDQKEVFNEYIWNPCKQGNSIGVAKLQLVMRCCTIRRTKDSVAEDGRRILNLPPRKEMQMWLDLREDEREVYDKRANALRDKVGALQQAGELGKNYANVLQEVLRLRQICNHVDLAMLGAVEEDYDGTVMDYQVAVQGIERTGLTLPRAQSIVSFRKDGEGAECDTCGLDYNDAFPSVGLVGVEDDAFQKPLKKLTHRPLLTKCLHLFCPTCFKKGIYPDYKPKMKTTINRPCSACDAPLRIPSDVIEVVPPGSEQAAEIADAAPKRAARKKFVRQPGEKPNLSTKMQFLLDDLMVYSRKNPNSVNFDPMQLGDCGEDGVEEMDAEGKPFITKSIVFSQWTTMLDRIGDMLDEANIRYDRLDGTMTREDRAKAMQNLKNNRKIEVLIVSTRAGGVGLNLTTASRAYLVDPYWNPSVEAQAIDRIHRMGQTRPVTAIKLMINNSIEMKLDAIQKKKANLANLSLKPMTRKELMEQKAEELASLFK